MTKPKSTTQRAIDRCDAQGWLVAKCEYTVQYGRRHVSRDLFGFADLIALDGFPGSLLIQVTDNTHVSERRRKILGKIQPKEKQAAADARRDGALRWLDCDNRIEVWGFYPDKPDPRIVIVVRSDFK